MSQFLRSCALCCLLLVPALAAASDWTGADVGNSPLWSDADNWNTAVPTSGAVAFPSVTDLLVVNDTAEDANFTPTFTGNGYVVVGNRINLIGTLAASGGTATNLVGLPIRLAGSRTVSVDANPGTTQVLVLGGELSGPGGIAKTSDGVLVLAGLNTCTGANTVTGGGTLMVTGSLPGSVTLNGGTLAGTGWVGSLATNNGGTNVVAPGSDGPGALTVSGNTVLQDTDTLRIRINGTTAGSGYSQIVAKGYITMMSHVVLDVGFTPVSGDVFTIIKNDGPDLVTTGGSAPAHGSSIAFPPYGTFQVSTIGGSGNDLTLTFFGTPVVTTTALASSAASVTVGTSVTLTATVTGAGLVPSGNVAFYDGPILVASVPTTAGVPANTSAAEFTFPAAGASSLTVGTHRFTARYAGGAADGPSTSVVLNQVVLPASGTFATATNLTTSLNPAEVGQSVTYTARVWSAGGLPAAGTVTFKDGGTTLATVAISASGAASHTRSFPTAPSTHPITAVYSGAGTFAASTSASLSQSVIAAGTVATVTALSSDNNPAELGDVVTFTATVTGGTAPSGTVRFERNGVFLGAAPLDGAATFSTAGLPAGTSTIRAFYQGDGTSKASASTSLAQVVGAPGSGGGGGGGGAGGGGGGCGAGGGAAVALLLAMGLVGRRRR